MRNPIEALLAQVKRDRLRPSARSTEYSYASLPLCVVDAVFSIGVRYKSVENTVARFASRFDWRVRGRSATGNGEKTVRDFLDLRRGRTPESLAKEVFGNNQRTSTRGGILKADACFRFAEALHTAEINDFSDLFDERMLVAEALILGIPGQSSGICYDYFLMLAGDEDMVKPDRLVQRYLSKALFGKSDAPISPRQASLLVKAAARKMKDIDNAWTARKLDHAIWLSEGGKVSESTP